MNLHLSRVVNMSGKTVVACKWLAMETDMNTDHANRTWKKYVLWSLIWCMSWIEEPTHVINSLVFALLVRFVRHTVLCRTCSFPPRWWNPAAPNSYLLAEIHRWWLMWMDARFWYFSRPVKWTCVYILRQVRFLPFSFCGTVLLIETWRSPVIPSVIPSL